MPDTPADPKEPCFLVIFTLTPDVDRTALFASLKSYTSWATLTSSVWAIVAPKSAKQLRDDIKKHLGEKDRLLVVKTGGEGAWRNFPNSSDWLKIHL